MSARAKRIPDRALRLTRQQLSCVAALPDGPPPESDGEPRNGPARLVRAVLADALICVAGRATLAGAEWGIAAQARAVLRDEALRWFRSRARAAWSYEWCCEVLGLDPRVIRAALPGIRIRKTGSCGYVVERPHEQRPSSLDA